MNSMVSRLLTIITGRLKLALEFSNVRTASSNQTNNQSRRSDFYKYTRLPVTRWVKISLNLELLVPK